MLKFVVILIVVAIAALLALAATRPDTFRVERVARIPAPPEKVFPLINDLHNWAAWSPWEKKDPMMQRIHSGAASGKGAVYEWDGNKEVGAGRMEITETAAPSRIVVQLDFIKPFEGHNIVEFTLTPQADGTQVNWAMHGPMPYISKIMSVFVSMDSLIGKDFEAGLANLKAAAEK